MQKYTTEVLVIGGGATGTGILRDLALRGFQSILVEKRDLSHGTTGRYHGLLHSGGRYVVKDPQAARECILENKILRRIMPMCIEDTGGYFVLTPWDDPGYMPRFEVGCQAAGIAFETIPIRHMLKTEPRLNPRITHCYRVPDASADSFLATDLNAADAVTHGARVLRYHEVIQLILEKSLPADISIPSCMTGNRVVGALVRDLVSGEEVEIHADLVINASGAWAGMIAATAGIQINIIPGKGTMVAMNHRIVNTVINRCKMPSDGDILVPAHTVAVIGTTDTPVNNPDRYSIEPWEVKLCLEEGEKMVPGFKQMRMLRAWAGVRPLYQETQQGNQTRDITRAYVLLDHSARDGVDGLVTITSGKWTTYRLMAEHTVDLVCQKFRTERPCRTHLEEIPGEMGENKFHYLGARLSELEESGSYGRLICECELATIADVRKAIEVNHAQTIDDIRRDVRLGMGPCQGGFCTFRVAGWLQRLRTQPPDETNLALREFLEERWKGLLPILWGQQLRQEYLDEFIYLSILNIDHLPGPSHSPLASEKYSPPNWEDSTNQTTQSPATQNNGIHKLILPAVKTDVLVIGAGFSGLMAAIQALQSTSRVRVLAKGWGTTHWDSGCVDILGYNLINRNTPIVDLESGLKQFIEANPKHPYSLIGQNRIEAALETFKRICNQAGYPLHGSLEQNWLLPSAAGAIRPTCLAPETMINGDLHRSDSVLIVGFENYYDFYPELIAANLNAQGIPTGSVLIAPEEVTERRWNTPVTLAQLFDDPSFIARIAALIKPSLGSFQRIGFPAVLGLQPQLQSKQLLEEFLGLPVFEIPGMPPSVPGMRLHKILINAIQQAGGQIFEGIEAVNSEIEGSEVKAILTESAARHQLHQAHLFILATGGFLGGGLYAEYNGQIMESVLNLPVNEPIQRSEWFRREFFDQNGHPIYAAGISSDATQLPLDRAGNPILTNTYLTGSMMGNSNPLRERSHSGISLVSGFSAGQNAARVISKLAY